MEASQDLRHLGLAFSRDQVRPTHSVPARFLIRVEFSGNLACAPSESCACVASGQDEKVYVQHRIGAAASLVWQALEVTLSLDKPKTNAAPRSVAAKREDVDGAVVEKCRWRVCVGKRERGERQRERERESAREWARQK
eukprot:83083-Rhodomonas_salina.1